MPPYHEANEGCVGGVSQRAPHVEESLALRRPFDAVDEVVAKTLHIRQVGSLSSHLGQQDLDSGNFVVPGEDLRVPAVSFTRVPAGGVGQIALSTCGFVEPGCSPDKLVVVTTGPTDRRNLSLGASVCLKYFFWATLLKLGTKLGVHHEKVLANVKASRPPWF